MDNDWHCPSCGYTGAMYCSVFNLDTGFKDWLRCHRCGTDSPMPDVTLSVTTA
jgi:hypothetical protein